MPLVKAMKVYQEDDHILLLPSDASIKQCMRISKSDGSLSLVERPPRKPGDFVLALGVLGIINLNGGPYLILITAERRVGRFMRNDIYQVNGTKVIRICSTPKLSAQQAADEAQYRAMLDTALSNPFYYSTTYDITNSLQRQQESDHSLPLHERADRRFFWNRHLLESFIAGGFNDWILPVMMGFIDINTVTCAGKKFDFLLISRRNINRAGTRYVVRGLDEHGNVANNIETEQIVALNDKVASLIQTRGSIPLFWNQRVNLKYKPKVGIDRDAESSLPFTRKHFQEQIQLYGEQLAVNLIDHKGVELELGQSFGKAVDGMDNVSYLAWDFHKECRKMKYENIDLLYKQLEGKIQSFGHFFSEGGEVRRKQTGTIRTNCMDNLDRSNVVQSVFARKLLPEMLSEVGVIDSPKPVAEIAELEPVFKHTWANNADAISKQYSGTGALKTDYTRTGKRTYKGLISDGINSLTRYYINNFADGFRQDSFDLFLGNYVVDPSKSPFASKPTTPLPKIGLATIVVFLVSLYLASGGFLPVGLLVMFLIWLITLFAGAKALLSKGRSWVDTPRLLTEKYE